MGLPTAREKTFGAGPVKVEGHILDTIQDQIIGSKVPSTTFQCPGAAWNVITGAPTQDANGLWTLQTAVDDELIYPVGLAAGTRLTAVSFSFNRNSNNVSGDVQLKLKKRAFGAGPANVFSGVVSAGTGFVAHESIAVDLAGVPYTLLAGFMYWLSIRFTGVFSGAPQFDGAAIVADRL